MGRRRGDPSAGDPAQLDSLAAVARRLNDHHELPALLEEAAEHALRLLAADFVWLSFGPEELPGGGSTTTCVIAGAGDDTPAGPAPSSACGCPSPLDQPPGAVVAACCAPREGESSWLHAAVALGDDRSFAVLNAAFSGRDALDGDQRALLGALAPVLASAIERVRLRELSARDAAERRLVEEALAASERRFRSLVQHASELIVVFDRAGAPSYASPASDRVLGVAPEELLTTWPHFVHSDDRFAIGRELRSVAAGEAAARIELRARHGDGSWRTLEGTLTNLLDDPDVGGIVANLRDVTERSRVLQELTRRTFYDPLTQLPNRAQLRDRLESALEALQTDTDRVALLVVDLDQFSVVNDSLGHATGDALLLGLARRLSTVVPRDMLLARIGGDEMAVLDERCASVSAATGLAEQIADALREPFHLAGREVFVTASIGVAVARTAGVDADDMLRDADAALNRAKRLGRNRVQLFDEEMRAWSLARLEGEHELRRALERGELRVLFQPEVWLRSGALAGLEALVAWQHPERGLLSAAQFIDLAEESGLVVPLSEWVLGEACRHARRWTEAGSRDQAVSVSVNVSARQLDRPDLPEVVARALDESGLDPDLLWLEITESALIEDPDHGIEVLRSLRELGCTIVIDDFGTGYSSLLYLRRLPVDVLKVDRSFVDGVGRDAQDTAIVSSVVELGHAFGLLVVAEGVERFEQLEAVTELGCDIGQGYHWAKPMTPEALDEWRSSFAPAPPDPAPGRVAVAVAAPADREHEGRVPSRGNDLHRFVLEATRAALRAECAEEVVGIAMALVRGLGGWTVDPRTADARALPVDLSFGVGEALFPAAEPGSVARLRIERVLPRFVDDARKYVARLVSAPAGTSGIDPVTGLAGTYAFERSLPRLRTGDAILMIDIGGFGPAGDGDPAYDDAERERLLRAFSRVLRSEARASDRCARIGDHVFAVTMAATSADGAGALVRRIRDEWCRTRPLPASIALGVALVDGDALVATERARRAMLAAQEAGHDQIQVDDRALGA